MHRFFCVMSCALALMSLTSFGEGATLVADYALGNAGNLGLDSSGNGNHGANNGALYAPTFQGGGAAYLSGGAKIVTGNLSTGVGNDPSISVTTWFYAKPGGGGGVIVDEVGDGGANPGWHDSHIEYQTNNTVRMSVWNYVSSLTSPALGLGWHQAAYTYNNGTQTLTGYIDGASIGSTTYQRQTPILNGGAQQFYALGPSDITNLGNGVAFNGTVGDTRVYAGALTPTEVANSFTAQAPSYVVTNYAQQVIADLPSAYYRLGETSGTTAFDASPNGNNGAYVGAPTLNQSSPAAVNAGINTNNGTGYVNVPEAAVGNWAGRAATTFEVSFKTTGSGVILGQNNAGATVDSNTPGPAGWVPAMYIGNDGILHSSLYWHSNTTLSTASASPVNDGKWHTAIAVFDTNKEDLWIDGKLVSTQVGIGEAGYAGNYEYHLGVGFTSSWPGSLPGVNGWEHFNGQLDDAAFYQFALTTAQINEHFRLVPEPSSLALFGMALLGFAQIIRRRNK